MDKIARREVLGTIALENDKQTAMKVYNQKVVDEIKKDLLAGVNVRTICKREDMPSEVTFFRWVNEDIGGFGTFYKSVQAASAYSMEEDILELSDDDEQEVGRSALQVKARQFIMQVRNPDRYSEKRKVEHTMDSKLSGIFDKVLEDKLSIGNDIIHADAIEVETTDVQDK